MGEFDFIARHFRPLAGKGAFDLRNDGAVLSIEPGHELVLSSDTMVENLHFLPDDPPETIGQKLLRCNISDIAAMGGVPYGYMLNVSVPPGRHYNDEWFSHFAAGLQQDHAEFGLSLLGGDTTGSPEPLVLSLTIFGTIQSGQALRRDGARPGHSVWVTGSLGKAALGLYARRGELQDPTGELTQAFHIPTPRVGLSLYGIVSAAMDVSDGVFQDIGHIATESGVAVTLQEKSLPLPSSVKSHLPQWRETALLGGDDYELLLTCPPENDDKLQKQCHEHHVPITRIGKVEEGQGVKMLSHTGETLIFSRTGWQHF